MNPAAPDAAGRAEDAAAAPDDRLVMATFMGQYDLPALAVADALGLFPLLVRSPVGAAEAARRLRLHPYNTEVLLALVAALGYLTVYEGAYHLTPAARAFLLPGTSRYWGPMLQLGWDEKCTAVQLAVREGKAHGYRGHALWETHSRVPRRADLFTAAMHAHSTGPAAALAARLDLAGAGTLLDVAGGAGTFAVALVKRHPQLTAQVLDLPAVADVARRTLEEAKVADRVRLCLRDMFDGPWPDGQDLVLFADTLCDWGDDACREMLARARAALSPGGRILVHQVMLDDSRTRSATAAGYALALATMSGGRLRTASELAGLLTEAGFTGRQLIPLYGHYSLMTARRG
ncbi:methyltransferase domain-containing protein [Streptomyces platensis]|uniref:Demethylspheroidene O-methyltransferase n=1 Tax=Streptomyces platensis TaxID=58346 RepID=A0AAE6TKK3_STRPT|nr:methyltransferase [Streptomyces platensis]OSY46305.1 Demethylspheroidene O-methyltransferase [Streptomyces platensis]QEV50340.1 methyltransferase domain-containing protein [Streptomyces platensis]